MAAEGLLALFLASAVEVVSTTPCPTAAEVEARLPPLTSPGGAPDRALVRTENGALTLTLERADGSAVVERQIAAQSSCADLAGAVALIVAVWQAQVRPALPPAPALAAPPLAPRLLSLEARTDLFASLAGAQVSPGATLSAVLWRRRWGLGVSLSGTAPREDGLGRGRASWARGTLGLGVVRRLAARWVRVDLDLAGLLGLTLAQGSGYQTDAAPLGSTVGASAGLTLSHAWGRLVVSAGARGARWLAQELAVDPGGARQALPRTEVRAGAGLGFQWAL